jgi:hypothetical protein
MLRQAGLDAPGMVQGIDERVAETAPASGEPLKRVGGNRFTW